ncbi:MAG TPA: hypothetical protein VH684_23770 [Xanthobacteraceae bacterium]|jgi:hypothetical protein
MSRAQPKFSPTDRYAKQIARAIAKDRPPRFDDGLESYCESSPREIFAAFAGAARHMPPAGKDQALALGYIFVLQRLLEHLRYRTDRGYADAAKLIADFQADLTRRTEAGELDGPILALLSGALHESKIPASPEFAAAAATRALAEAEDEPVADDPHDALAGIIRACGGHPFRIAGALLEAGHGRPTEHRAVLVTTLAFDSNPQARSAAVLFLLDPEAAIRREIAEALGQAAASLTATDVRRLIAIRNWRPEQERAQVDAVIRKARAAGIECAQWEQGVVEAILASAIDGSEAQAFLVISPVGRKRRLSSILTKGGVADAFSGEPERRRRLEEDMEAMGAPTLPVSRQYLDDIIADHMARGIAKGAVPPLGLLEVAETIGGADWQPARKDFRKTLAGLVAEIPKPMREPGALASVLRNSGELPDLEVIAEAWFEDDPQVANAVQRAGGRDRKKLASYLLQSVIERRREKWADLLLRTAAWMRQAIPQDELCWRELALVAQAVAEGRDLNEIGLMRDIARRTVEVINENSGRV